MPSRREFLRSSGALIVSFASAFAISDSASAQGVFGTHPSHIDPEKLDSWIAVNADGTITAHTGKCDFGQGIFTAQTQLVAEELCVPISRVRLIQCDTDITPDQGTTSGSQSTPTNFNDKNLARAAATAREALLSLAAQKFGEPVADLSIADGVIASRTGQRIRYQELLAGQHFNVALNPAAKRRSIAQWTVLGKPVSSLDRVDLMTGRFEFLHHITVPAMVHGRLVRPPQMGARLISVEDSSVRHIPGLIKVVVRKDFVGVVAEKQYQAVLPARQLAVRWSPGPKLAPQRTFLNIFRPSPGKIRSASIPAISKNNSQMRAGSCDPGTRIPIKCTLRSAPHARLPT